MRRENIGGTTFCISCGVHTGETTYQNEYDDAHSVRVTDLNNDDLERECRRTFDHFQGRCGYPDIKPNVLNIMRENLPIGRVSKHDVRDMLKKTRLQKYNKHVHHVHYLLTGVPKNDIERLEDRLIGEIEYISGEFMISEGSLNKQYLMMLLLESHGEKYDRSEFFFPRSMVKYEVT